MSTTQVQRVGEVGGHEIEALLGRLGLNLTVVRDADAIPGSFWGDSEAGIIGDTLYARSDTPVHSVLHETCHFVCMDASRRASLHTDAGGSHLEEAAVCYLQILLSDSLAGVGRKRLMLDMDRWGYSFRLGSTGRWFREDADDARTWLLDHDLIEATGLPTFRLRDQPA